jgi:hypothetical protein
MKILISAANFSQFLSRHSAIVCVYSIFIAFDTRPILHMSISTVIQHGFSQPKASPSATRNDEVALLSLLAALKKVLSQCYGS